jgi:tRNA(Ser,Leu) C12 N-acetylase TAN1
VKDWNVVVTVYEEGYRPAQRILRQLGQTSPSSYHNLLLMKVDDPVALLETLKERAEAEPGLAEVISRVAPAMANFDFNVATDFEEKAKATALAWLPRLANTSFHVRLHHRGTALNSPAEEQRIAEALLAGLEAAGTPGRIAFDDPDAIIAIDTVDGRAGLGLWTRSDLSRYRFLRPD